MAKESVLSDKEKDSFEIEKFIFHIIIQDGLTPIYLDEVNLEPDQIEFFKKRFIDISEGVQHVFSDRANSNFVSNCTEMLSDPDANFINMSKKISYSFKQEHNKNTTDGVFITSIVKVEGTRRLIFLLKLDNRKVYQYKLTGNKALLEEIKQTFVEDKKAIQKSALIDISDHYSWDVLAMERNPGSKTAIRDYFSKFLTVVEKETPSKLTLLALSAVKNWAITNKSDLDPDQDVSSYKSRAVGYLMGTGTYKTKNYLDAVIIDDDLERKDRLTKSLKAYFDEVGLSGQSFTPNKNSVSQSARKNVRKTAEDVKIEWVGDPAESNITIPSERNKNDDLYHIIIKTREIYNKDY
jgi:hypothetical protein